MVILYDVCFGMELKRESRGIGKSHRNRKSICINFFPFGRIRSRGLIGRYSISSIALNDTSGHFRLQSPVSLHGRWDKRQTGLSSFHSSSVIAYQIPASYDFHNQSAGFPSMNFSFEHLLFMLMDGLNSDSGSYNCLK